MKFLLILLFSLVQLSSCFASERAKISEEFLLKFGFVKNVRKTDESSVSNISFKREFITRKELAEFVTNQLGVDYEKLPIPRGGGGLVIIKSFSLDGYELLTLEEDFHSNYSLTVQRKMNPRVAPKR